MITVAFLLVQMYFNFKLTPRLERPILLCKVFKTNGQNFWFLMIVKTVNLPLLGHQDRLCRKAWSGYNVQESLTPEDNRCLCGEEVID